MRHIYRYNEAAQKYLASIFKKKMPDPQPWLHVAVKTMSNRNPWCGIAIFVWDTREVVYEHRCQGSKLTKDMFLISKSGMQRAVDNRQPLVGGRKDVNEFFEFGKFDASHSELWDEDGKRVQKTPLYVRRTKNQSGNEAKYFNDDNMSAYAKALQDALGSYDYSVEPRLTSICVYPKNKKHTLKNLVCAISGPDYIDWGPNENLNDKLQPVIAEACKSVDNAVEAANEALRINKAYAVVKLNDTLGGGPRVEQEFDDRHEAADWAKILRGQLAPWAVKAGVKYRVMSKDKLAALEAVSYANVRPGMIAETADGDPCKVIAKATVKNFARIQKYDDSGAMADDIKNWDEDQGLVAVRYRDGYTAVWVYDAAGAQVEGKHQPKK